MLPLNDEQRILVEENMGLVGKVIKDCLQNPSAQGCYTYDDLFQIGCIGLCKAAQTDRPGRGAFSTYAYILIRNEIYNELERGTRYAREVSSCYLELEDDPRQEDYEQQLRCRELMSLLDRAEATATGITAKGIRALHDVRWVFLQGDQCPLRYHPQQHHRLDEQGPQVPGKLCSAIPICLMKII